MEHRARSRDTVAILLLTLGWPLVDTARPLVAQPLRAQNAHINVSLAAIAAAVPQDELGCVSSSEEIPSAK